MSWFKELVGFEESAEAIRENVVLEGSVLRSRVNGRSMQAGELWMPSLRELQSKWTSQHTQDVSLHGELRVSEMVADARELHRDPSNAGAFFQVASQFNLLEMVGPSVTPEMGISGYQHDHTQGPVCAMSCGAGTLYRNWFVDVDGSGRNLGQTAEHQLDMLRDVGRELGNEHEGLWLMRNGYALANPSGYPGMTEWPIRSDALRIGLQVDTEVTLEGAGHLVTQAYCSAVPVSYTGALSSRELEPFARMVLRSSYAATMLAAALHCAAGKNPKIYLTLIGGGAFGNRTPWITEAIAAALEPWRTLDAEVMIVSYGRSNPRVADMVRLFHK